MHPYVRNGTKQLWHEFTLPCQQAGTTLLPAMVDAYGQNVRMWVGDGWTVAAVAEKV